MTENKRKPGFMDMIGSILPPVKRDDDSDNLRSDQYNPQGLQDDVYNPKDVEFPDTNSTDGVDHLVVTDERIHKHDGKGRLLDLHDWFDPDNPPTDAMLDSAINHPTAGDRDIRDIALQVDQLRANMIVTRSAYFPTLIAPVQVAWATPERRNLRILTSGNAGCLYFIGNTALAAASLTNAFTLGPNANIVLNYFGDLWVGASVAGAANYVSILEEIRNADRA